MTAPTNETNIRPMLSVWLTQAEWKMVYAYGWTAYWTPCYGLEGLDEQQREELVGTKGRVMLWAIRNLANRHGMRFAGLGVDGDGRVYMTSPEPICLENEIYVKRFEREKGPHYGALLSFAIDYSREHLRDFDVEPLREMLARILDDIRTLRAEISDEERELMNEGIEYWMQVAGLKKAAERHRAKPEEVN